MLPKKAQHSNLMVSWQVIFNSKPRFVGPFFVGRIFLTEIPRVFQWKTGNGNGTQKFGKFFPAESPVPWISKRIWRVASWRKKVVGKHMAADCSLLGASSPKKNMSIPTSKPSFSGLTKLSSFKKEELRKVSIESDSTKKNHAFFTGLQAVCLIKYVQELLSIDSLVFLHTHCFTSFLMLLNHKFLDALFGLQGDSYFNVSTFSAWK